MLHVVSHFLCHLEDDHLTPKGVLGDAWYMNFQTPN